MPVTISSPHPQEQNRTFRSFRDQHGRRWGGVIEQKTGLWVGTLSAMFTAPVLPPHNYIIPTQDGAEVEIDYRRWLSDTKDAWNVYNARFYEIAHAEYKDNPGEAVKNPTPWLLRAVGRMPTNPSVIEACMSGNKWILGLSDKKPAWAFEFFPAVYNEEVSEMARRFPDAEEDGETEGVWPRDKKFGRWELSNGSVFKGSKDEALVAEAGVGKYAEV